MSCSKKHASSSSLPDDILFQILSKLPAKSLMRFRCVSKFFSSLLVDHPFADLHRNLSLTLPSRMSILIFFRLKDPRRPRTNRCYTINYSEEDQGALRYNRLHYIDHNNNGELYTINYYEAKNQGGALQANHLHYMDDGGELFENSYYIRSAVNGLLCFCRYPQQSDRDDIVIHNLSTRHHISLPTTCIVPLNSSTDHRMNVCGLLGFDSVSRRYKVLKSVQFTDHCVKHWVFTLGLDKSWRLIDDCYPSFHPYNLANHSFYYRTSVHIDGVIYSLNSLKKRDCSKFHIVAFDVAAENFRTIPSPPWNDRPPYLTAGLIEVEGRLAIVDTGKRRGLDYYMGIWTLEEESMVWKKMRIIPIPIPREYCQTRNVNERSMLFYTTNHIGEIALLVKLTTSVSIFYYNFTRQSWRKFDISEFSYPLSRGRIWSIAMHFHCGQYLLILFKVIEIN